MTSTYVSASRAPVDMSDLKITTWNVNGLRAILRRSVNKLGTLVKLLEFVDAGR